MNNIRTILSHMPPRNLIDAQINWPIRDDYTPSPNEWRNQIFYFLMVDRFSNGKETSSNMLTCDLSSPAGINQIRAIRGANWSWADWQTSGASRFQGGTLKGITSKLPYLEQLGITTIWVSPIWRQRVEENSYHGYGIQDFFDVDSRFGTRKDLIELVDAAHSRNMKIVCDVIFNHSGCNWLYDSSAGNSFEPPYKPTGSYSPIWPRNGFGAAITNSNPNFGNDDYVWPDDLQGEENYTRAGKGSLANGAINDDYAEHKRSDFMSLRKFNLYNNDTLLSLALVYQYWIALADIDGMRIDTLKHVTFDQARNFCNSIKEYAEVIGKNDFFLLAEIAGGDQNQDQYLDVIGRNLNACLDIGMQRETICNVGKGLEAPVDFFNGFNYGNGDMGSHRNYGSHHVSISNDHDHVFGSKIRLSTDASNDHQGAAVAAIQLFSLGIPCLYYGIEQGLASGAESDQRQYIQNWGSSDTLLRETMFGPQHPLASGWDGTQGHVDTSKPGFGPHGTAGWHVFNTNHPIYSRIASFSEIRKKFKALSHGRQYQRDISFDSNPFSLAYSGHLMAWSRVFDIHEVVVIVNTNGVASKQGRIVIDNRLSSTGMKVVLNTDPSAASSIATGALLSISSWEDWHFIELDAPLAASEVMVLANYWAIEDAKLVW